MRPIWPTLHEKRFFETNSAVSIDKGCVYLSGPEKERLMQPVKCHDFTQRFRGTRTSEKGLYFTKPEGQENDYIDPVLTKYYRTQDRGLIRPKSQCYTRKDGKKMQVTEEVPKSAGYPKGTDGVFRPV